jgi:dolichyl-phosphate-mannose-protein mannosyltransferase
VATTVEAPGSDATGAGAVRARAAGRLPSAVERLRVAMPTDLATSWIATLVVTAVAAVFRFWAIGFPAEKVFDETYYATEGAEITKQGFENNPSYMFIVHPPLGKWIIAAGIRVFGDNSTGWRVPGAIVGTLTVLILIRTVRRMTRSTLLGCAAGLLLAVDGLSVVLSRFALLDIYVAFFVVAGFACLVLDRDWMRERLARAIEAGTFVADSARRATGLGWRPWRIAGGALLGLSCAVKWSGIYFLLGFGLLSVFTDWRARRTAGSRRPLLVSLLRDTPSAFVALVFAPVWAYLAAWTGWFRGESSYSRHWGDSHREYWSWLGGPLRGLIHYHWEMWHFHKGLDSPHPYQSMPWSWLVSGRPVLFYYPSKPAPVGCGAETCVRSVLAVGTPTLWWAFVPALLWALWLLATRADWRGGLVLIAWAAGWAAWFYPKDRTEFIFYMSAAVPFGIIGVTLMLGEVLGRARAGEIRRLVGQLCLAGYLGLVMVNFIWLWPILSGQLMSYDDWHSRIWFGSWI